MVIINPLEDRAIKAWAKRVFKDVDLMPKGFAIDCINVKFSDN